MSQTQQPNSCGTSQNHHPSQIDSLCNYISAEGSGPKISDAILPKHWGRDSPKKTILLRFMLYDGKSNPRSHVSHVRQIMTLWNHLDALMCRVFPSSLWDLRLKWFNRLPAGSIESFHQLTKSFVARFIINTKAPNGIGSLLTLRKRQKWIVLQL